MTGSQNDVVTVDRAIAARQAKILKLLRKVTLAQLSPDPAYRAEAAAVWNVALGKPG